MQSLSLKKKIIMMVLGISLIGPMIAGFIIIRNNETTDQFKIIAERSLPRTRQM